MKGVQREAIKGRKQGVTITQIVHQVQKELELQQHTMSTIIRALDRVNETTAALNNRMMELERNYYALIKRRRS